MASKHEAAIHQACVVCGGGGLLTVPAFSAVHLVRCSSCGTRFAGRAPSDTELDGHYRGYGDWPDSAITRDRYRELLASFEPYRRNGRIFDMGCGPGYFLEEAAARGWSPHGSNVGEKSIAMCRDKGLDVVEAPLREGAFPDGHFDVVTAFEVFEHLREPGQEAQTLARLVRPGGLLYCTTPNFDSLSRRVLGAKWRVISYPEHLVYFTAATLTTWLEGHGFRAANITSTGVSLGDLRRGLRSAQAAATAHQPGSATPDIDARLRAATESGRLLPLLKAGANRALTITGTGDTLKAWLVRLPA